jgi:hypothetical protein
MYGTLDYGAWLVERTRKRLATGVGRSAVESVGFALWNLAKTDAV